MPPPPPASHTDPSPWILPLVMSSLETVQVEKGGIKMMVSFCYHGKTGVTRRFSLQENGRRKF